MSEEQPRKKQKSMSPSSSTSAESVAVAAVRPFAVKEEPVTKPLTIHEIASNGDVDAIKEFLDRGVDIAIRDSRGYSALHCAVEHNREGVVKFLLEKDGNVSLRGHRRSTPLHTASYFGRSVILKHLIEAGANLNAVNSKKQTPLMLSCMKGHFEFVKILLDSEADVSKADSCGLTALMHAANQGGMSQSGSEGQPAMDSALEMRYLNIAGKLIEKGAKINSVDYQNQTALHFAASKGNVKMIRILRKLGAKHSLVDNKNRTALDEAGLNGHVQAVYEILEFLPEGSIPLSSMEMAALNGDINFMTFLFEAFSPEDFYTCKAVHKAASCGHLECVQLLIKEGFDVSRLDHRCMFPLQYAAEWGKLECVRELLKAGANANARYVVGYCSHADDENRSTALHFAAQYGHKRCVEELLKAGAKHILCENKYPWQVAKNEEIKQLLQEHQKQQQFNLSF